MLTVIISIYIKDIAFEIFTYIHGIVCIVDTNSAVHIY